MKIVVLLVLCASLTSAFEKTRDPQMCKVMPNMVSWLSDACTFKNVCFNGQLVSQPDECPANASCGTEDGEMACVCDAGFQWDANKKNCIDPKNPAKSDLNAVCKDSDGSSYQPGISYLVNSCSYLKLCVEGTLHTQCYECPQNSYCGKEEGSDACICEGKFHWDANKKNCVA